MTSFPRRGLHPTFTAGLCVCLSGVWVGCITPVVRARAPMAYGVIYDNGSIYAYDTYPRYTYDGQVVFLVGDRWYFQGDRGWAYYSSEPPGLWAYRRDYYGRYGYAQTPRYGAPPAYQGRFVAPPARAGRAPTAAPDAPRGNPSMGAPAHGPAAVSAPRAQQQEAPQREMPQRDMQQREAQQRDVQQREAQQRDVQQRDFQQRQAQQREARPIPGQAPRTSRPFSAPRPEPSQQFRRAPGPQQQQQQPRQQPENDNNRKRRDGGKAPQRGAR